MNLALDSHLRTNMSALHRWRATTSHALLKTITILALASIILCFTQMNIHLLQEDYVKADFGSSDRNEKFLRLMGGGKVGFI